MKRIIALFLVVVATNMLLAKVTAPSPAEKAEDGSKFSTRTYSLADFTYLHVSNVVKVIYTQGDSYKVQLTGRTDWLDLMEVTSKGGTLKVQAKKTKKFDNVKKRAAFSTMGNLESADTVYQQSKFITDVEINKYHRYHELKGKSAPTADELREIKSYAYLDEYTEDALRKENMTNYTELQKVVAEIVNMLKLTVDEGAQL